MEVFIVLLMFNGFTCDFHIAQLVHVIVFPQLSICILAMVNFVTPELQQAPQIRSRMPKCLLFTAHSHKTGSKWKDKCLGWALP